MSLKSINVMRRRNFKYRFLVILSISFCINSFGQTANRSMLETQRRELLQEIKKTNGLIVKADKTLSSKLARYRLLKLKKRKINQVITTIQKEKRLIDQAIVQLNHKIRNQETQLEKLKVSYKKGLVSAYKNQDKLNPLAFLLTSDSFNSALRKLTYLRRVNAYRGQQANSIKALLRQLDQARKTQLEERKAKNQLLQKQQVVQADLTMSEKEVQAIIASLKAEKGKLEQLIQEKQKAQKRLQVEIRKLIALEIAKKKAKERLSVKNDSKKADKVESFSETPVSKKLSKAFVNNKGKLPWPLEKGVIVGSIGQYKDDFLPGIKRERDGVDIRTERGAIVKSIFAGKVISLTTIPGFNKVVILSHGKYFSVYGRLQSINVNVGDTVSVGDSLGKLEEKNGVSELHLQLWHKQEKLNPKQWLKK